jgi:SAM-dependent methyltransferase
LPFADGSVDAIVNIESACHFRDRARFLAECARVLRPGGRLAGQDWMATDELDPAAREQYIAPLEAAWFLWNLDSLSSYQTMLEDAGFRVKVAEPIGAGILPNGYFMRLCYLSLLFTSTEPLGNAVEHATMERFRSFSDALLDGFLTVGRYVATKP